MLQPEPEVAVPPSRRAERVPLVGDIHVEFPYSGNDVCKKCGNPLSRYNPHVVCYVCIDKLRRDSAYFQDAAVRKILDMRRPRNRRCPNISKSLNTALIGQAVSTGSSRGRHYPQSGQS